MTRWMSWINTVCAESISFSHCLVCLKIKLGKYKNYSFTYMSIITKLPGYLIIVFYKCKCIYSLLCILAIKCVKNNKPYHRKLFGCLREWWKEILMVLWFLSQEIEELLLQISPPFVSYRCIALIYLINVFEFHTTVYFFIILIGSGFVIFLDSVFYVVDKAWFNIINILVQNISIHFCSSHM